jgi:N-acetylglucosamine kinase-like BadF-type ATPase
VKYYAGIDGGQSSTTAVIAGDTGEILARGTAGPADEVGVSADSTRLHDALNTALSNAIINAKLEPATQFESIVAGVSGYEGRVYGKPPELPARKTTLLHDAPVAHAGALGGKPGIIVIAGTGSVAYGVGERGQAVTVGGWGYLFGDEGSAFWIAREALSGIMRDRDAGRSNDLLDDAMKYFNYSSLRAMSRAFYMETISREQLAAFARIVIHAGEMGSEAAERLTNDAADAIANLAALAARQLRQDAPGVALMGGLMQSKTMREAAIYSVRRILPNAELVPPRHDAATGALILALREDGLALAEGSAA